MLLDKQHRPVASGCYSWENELKDGVWTYALADAEKGLSHPVPTHLRDTHYKGAERVGAGVGYMYPHDYPGHYVEQQYAPMGAEGERYYTPSEQGAEQEIRRIRAARGKKDGPDPGR